MYVHDGIESAWTMGSRPVHVRLTLRDGRVLECQIDISKGNPEVPLTAAELNVKFEDCAGLSLNPTAIRSAAQALQNLESLGSIAELTLCLAGGTRAAAVALCDQHHERDRG